MNDLDAEIESLAKRYGKPWRQAHEYIVRSNEFANWVKKLTRRRGEVILIVPRGKGRVLLHTKPYYPEGVYRLPTGGIHQGEAADLAARREALEETSLDAEPKRLLGVLENIFLVEGKRIVYPSFIFEMPALSQAPHPTDSDEPISGFCDASPEKLGRVGEQLDSLKSGWAEWGAFRAVPHRLLGEKRSA